MLEVQKAIKSLDYGWSILGPEDFEKRLHDQRAFNTTEIVVSKLQEITANHPVNRPLQALTYGGTILSSGVSYVLILWSFGNTLNKITKWANCPLPIPEMTNRVMLIRMLALTSFVVFNHYNERYSMGDLTSQLQEKLTPMNR